MDAASGSIIGGMTVLSGAIAVAWYNRRGVVADAKRLTSSEISAAGYQDQSEFREDMLAMIGRNDKRITAVEDENHKLRNECIDLRRQVGELEISNERVKARIDILLDRFENSIKSIVGQITQEFRILLDPLGPLIAEMRHVLHPDTPIGGPELERTGIPAAAQPTTEQIEAIRNPAK